MNQTINAFRKELDPDLIFKNRKLSSVEKGKIFEKYIKSCFNKHHFVFVDTSTSISEGFTKDAVKCLFPDFKVVYKAKRKKYLFAVECKWRERFIDGKINWATEKQIKNYKAFQTKNNLTVFVAIGVGGLCSKPYKLFVTPLDKIEMKTEVYETDLFDYKRKVKGNFYYDTIQLQLF